MIQAILEVKNHFDKDGTQECVVCQIFKCADILKGLQVLVVAFIFIFGNLKDCLMKILQLLLQVIIASIES